MSWFRTTLQDIRYGLRTLRRSPGFAVTAIAVLALAVGANTAMFGVLHAVLLRPLPFRDPGRLAMIWTENPAQGIREGRAAFRRVDEWRRAARSFDDLACFDPASVTLAMGGRVERIRAVRVSPNFFPVLGVQPEIGRMPADAEEVLVSRALWQRRSGDSIEIDGRALRIAGVAALAFPGAEADVWLFPGDVGTGRSWFVLGRLRDGLEIQQAQAELSAIAQRLDPDIPAVSVVPLAVQITGPRARLSLWLLAGSVFLVLLIAATNIAGLTLARGAARQREFATRFALGASRSRLVRQLLAESLTLSAIAGVVGLFIANAALRLVIAARPGDLARLNEASLDRRALAASFVLCALTGIAVGLAPALTAGRRAAPHAGRRLRRALVVAQFASAIVLLAGAGLLLRSLWTVEAVDPGFRPERILSLQTVWRRPDLYPRLLEQLAATPGVESAAVVSDLFTGGSPESTVSPEGAPPARVRLRSDEISDGFFRTVGARLLRGRFFLPADSGSPHKLAIVNDALARRLWPGEDPVGRRFRPGAGPWFTVVGVVADMRRQGLEVEPIPQMFEPLAQNPPRLATVLVRASATLAPAVEAAIHQVDRQAPVYGVTTLERRIGAYLAPRRFQAALLAGFSALALLIAAIGIYGLVQYSVAARTREIAIRVAVGARGSEVFAMVLKEGLLLCVAGLALGLAVALWLGRLAAGLLFGIAANDPLTFAAASLLLITVAAAACYLPARRAMKLDPVAALRQS